MLFVATVNLPFSCVNNIQQVGSLLHKFWTFFDISAIILKSLYLNNHNFNELNPLPPPQPSLKSLFHLPPHFFENYKLCTLFAKYSISNSCIKLMKIHLKIQRIQRTSGIFPLKKCICKINRKDVVKNADSVNLTYSVHVVCSS